MKINKNKIRKLIIQTIQEASGYGDMFDPYNPEGHPEPSDKSGSFSRPDELAPVGGGLGRGLELARKNLKNALEDLYQEVVDGLTDEFDPGGEGVGSDETMSLAYEETLEDIRSVVNPFVMSIKPPRYGKISERKRRSGG